MPKQKINKPFGQSSSPKTKEIVDLGGRLVIQKKEAKPIYHVLEGFPRLFIEEREAVDDIDGDGATSVDLCASDVEKDVQNYAQELVIDCNRAIELIEYVPIVKRLYKRVVTAVEEK